MLTMKFVWFLDVNKVANELYSPYYAKVGAPQADSDSNDSSNPPKFFLKNVFLSKNFDWNRPRSYNKLLN